MDTPTPALRLAATALAASATAAVALLLLLRRRRRRSPPSVGRLPLVGSHWHLREPWYRDLHERFGHLPVVTLHMGQQRLHVFNQWAPFREAMVDNAEALSGRFSQFIAEKLFGDTGGLVAGDGEVWREYRRFTLRSLRDFGLGRQGGERLVLDEAEQLCGAISAAGGRALETTELMATAASNVVCQLVFGSRLASEDPRFADLLKLIGSITQNEDSNANNSFFLTLSPILQRLPPLIELFRHTAAFKEVTVNFGQLLQYCTEHQKQHEEALAGVHSARDFIEAHLLHQRDHPQVFNDTRMTFAVVDLFVAGTDTTANTMRWALLFMIDNPDVAEKVHREIADSIGVERLPRLADKRQLHYTQATVEEVLRRSSLVCLGLIHRLTADVTVAGYDLQRDDLCQFNVYAIHHDARLFPEPTQFRPERHLRDGQFVACEQLASFGLGRRSCLGESLARAELFVFFAAVMQRFRLSLDPEDPRSVWDLTEDPGLFKGSLMRAPPRHKIVFSPR